MIIRRISFFLILTVFLFAASLNAEERKISRITLDNGMTVILEEDKSAPVASLQLWVKVGSADEKEGEYGIAHVFEHMLFKGTAKRGVGEIAKEVEAAGGDINAYTSYDNTVYHITVPSRLFPTALDILNDAAQNSAFDPQELNKELEVVLEEIRMGEDSPERKLYKTLFSTAYTNHPYKRPVIGFKDSVKGIKREQIIEFFKKWYIPNNMTLVIVGDFDGAKALELIKKSFENFKQAPDPHEPRPIEPLQTSLKASLVKQDITEARIAMGFHIPSLSHADTYTLDIVQSILAEGVTSRLYKKLKIDNSLVSAISAYAMTPKEPGVFMITSTLSARNVKKAMEEIISELKKLSMEGPAARELEKAKLSLESDFIYSRETMDGKARQLGYYEVTAGDIDFEKRYIDGIKKVGADDIKRVLNEYFTVGNMTVAAVIPEADDKTLNEKDMMKVIKKADKNSASIYAKKTKDKKDVKKVTLPGGIMLIVKEDHSNPTVAVYAAFPGGLRFETPSTNGLSNFTAGMMTYGTLKRTREELSGEIEDIAGGVNGFSGKNSTGVSAYMMSRFFDKGMELFADVLLNPAFPDHEIEKLRQDILSAIKREEDYLPGYTFKLLYRELFKNHPYGMTVNGTLENVGAFKKEDLIRQYEKIFLPERLVISIVGDINSDYAVQKIKEIFKDFVRKGDAPVNLAMENPPPSIISVGEEKKKAQTNIGIGFIGPTITSDDAYAMGVLTEVLGSQGGRLFVELRDIRSLAYAVSAFARPGVETGGFGVYIGAAPEKKEEAIKGILDELKKVITEKITEEELKRAKNSLIGNYEMALEGSSSQASDMTNNELLGLGYEHYKRYAKKIQNVTAEDVLKVARKYILLDRYVISVVGPDK